jgi:hypothetical protein
MMYVALTGHHGAGKSHFAGTLSVLSGWPIQNKASDLRRIYENRAMGTSISDDWDSWSKAAFQPDQVQVTLHRLIALAGKSPITLLDAVHNPEEWDYIKRVLPGSILVGVFTPECVRIARRDESPEKSLQRVRFWHAGGDCLMASVDWGVTGILPKEATEAAALQLISYVHKTL